MFPADIRQMVTSHDELLKLGVNSRDGRVVVSLGGEIDASNAPALRHGLRNVLENRPTAVVLDLRDLFFLDSAGVTEIVDVRTRAQAEDIPLSLSAPRPLVLRVLELSGVSQIIPIEDHCVSNSGPVADDAFSPGR